ncbi:hypothetical protein RI844_05185 [Thalassotalea fonticola]|uniref:Uncharacterized protein n=1 Tax=Thalassotalea fonticola TaxID=3065649 RepID=A0ABZ0GSF4_9GAMM|nr:hypothetical protein RI844_05185 [Colwelliaceae bacterium S1-1]
MQIAKDGNRFVASRMKECRLFQGSCRFLPELVSGSDYFNEILKQVQEMVAILS